LRARNHLRVKKGVRIRIGADQPREPRCSWTPTGVTLTVGRWRLTAEDLHRTRSGQTATVSVHYGEELCYREHLNLDRARPRQQFLANFVRICRPPLRPHAQRLTETILIRLGDECRRRPETQVSAMTLRPAQRVLDATPEARVRVLLDDPYLLLKLGRAIMENGWAGDSRIPTLAYVALTSRLLERPMNLTFVATPSAGKNAALDAALALG